MGIYLGNLKGVFGYITVRIFEDIPNENLRAIVRSIPHEFLEDLNYLDFFFIKTSGGTPGESIENVRKNFRNNF